MAYVRSGIDDIISSFENGTESTARNLYRPGLNYEVSAAPERVPEEIPERIPEPKKIPQRKQAPQKKVQHEQTEYVTIREKEDVNPNLPSLSIWNVIKSHFLIFVCLSVLACSCVGLGYIEAITYGVEKNVVNKSAEITRQINENIKLKSEVAEMYTPEEIENYAVSTLGMVKRTDLYENNNSSSKIGVVLSGDKSYSDTLTEKIKKFASYVFSGE